MKTTIEINGKLYDARTGKVVSKSTANSSSGSNNGSQGQSKSHLTKGVVMDGVAPVKPPAGTQPKTKPSNFKTTHKPAQSQQFAQDIKRPKPVQSITSKHHSVTVQKSQTLNRKVVKKPEPANKPAVHAKSATPSSSIHSRVEHSATGRGMLMKRVPESRLTRAMAAPKSALVTKFGREKSKKPQLTPHLYVKQAPENSQKAQPHLDKPVNTVAKEIVESPQKRSVFEDHLLKANSHKQKAVKKDKLHKRALRKLRISPKIASVTAAAFAVLLLGGFFAYQNIPAVSMRIAANRAGFSGQLPGSIPAGYAFKGPAHGVPNNIVLTYQSNSDDREFVILQKPTNWSSEALLTNYLLDSQFRYQVYRDKGLTVYIYNGSNATWVDKGVWYNVNSRDDSLSSEQLLEIASSI